MDVERRDFLRLLGAAALLAPTRAAAGAGAPAIHSQTRNSPMGAVGPRRAPLREAGPFKPYPGAPRLPLPPLQDGPARPLAQLLDDYEPTPGFAGKPLELDALSSLLRLTNGVTGRAGRTLLRAAPSAGALYAGEVYVVAERVQGLEPGVYYYDVADHGLIRIRSGALRDAPVAAHALPPEVENAAALLVLTNVFRRYTVRYRNRGYRYALIDSGHIGENLRLVARALGLGETAPPGFQDAALAAVLGIEGPDEAVCALHAIGSAGPASGRSPLRLVERQHVDPGVLQGSGPVTARYHQATELVPAPAGLGDPAIGRASAPDADPAPASRIPLAAAPAPGAAIVDAILGRRSAAGFVDRPVSPGDLAFVLEAAGGHPALARAPGVDVYVVVHRVTGMAPGLCRFRPGSRRLERFHARDLRLALARACLGQARAGSAAVAIAMVARFEPSGTTLGSRRYRDQLIEAGAIGQRIYLAAESLGLAARNLAAFIDEDLNALLGLDPRRAGVIHLTVFGRETT